MMFMMRSHHMLTDVILEVGTELFHAHKVILAAASPYFKVSLTAVCKSSALHLVMQVNTSVILSLLVSEYQERMMFVSSCVTKCKAPSVVHVFRDFPGSIIYARFYQCRLTLISRFNLLFIFF